MIQFKKKTNLIIGEMKKDFIWSVAVSACVKDPTLQYTLCSKTGTPTLAILMSNEAYQDALAAIDPAETLTPAIKYIQLPIISAGVRAEETLRLVTGDLPYEAPNVIPGEPNGVFALGGSGFEKKILIEGRESLNITEVLSAEDGAVTTSKPIADADSIWATKAGGNLEVDSVDLKLGIVNLLDEGSPVADGTNVSISYQTGEYAVVQLTDNSKKVVAVVLSKTFADFMADNT